MKIFHFNNLIHLFFNLKKIQTNQIFKIRNFLMNMVIVLKNNLKKFLID